MSEKILEKILTLNVNTNVDVQSIIEKYVLYTSVAKVMIAFLICFVIYAFILLGYKLIKEWQKAAPTYEAMAKIREIIASVDDWKSLRSLNTDMNNLNSNIERLFNNADLRTETAMIKDMHERLLEAISYLPRNKKPRV